MPIPPRGPLCQYTAVNRKQGVATTPDDRVRPLAGPRSMKPPHRPQMKGRRSSWTLATLSFALLVLVSGCGTIREHRATSQLLLSDAVDRSIASIDFSPLANEKVYLDSRYLQFKNDSAVTTNYVISALRQQMIVAGCLLHDQIADAKYVVEVRVGTMGSDGHEINYGIPASNSVNAAASLISGSPALPALPEISLGRKTEDLAAVKISAFAYDRETRLPIWQSGESLARSTASGAWVLGAGPFKWGSIYESPQFAGRQGRVRLRNPFKTDQQLQARDLVYRGETIWDPELRQRVAEGQHLLPPPDPEPTEPPAQVAEEASDDTRG